MGCLPGLERRCQRRNSENSDAFRAREALSTTEQRKIRCLPCPRGALNDGRAKNRVPSVLERRCQRRNSENSGAFRVRKALSTTEQREIDILPCSINALLLDDHLLCRCQILVIDYLPNQKT